MFIQDPNPDLEIDQEFGIQIGITEEVQVCVFDDTLVKKYLNFTSFVGLD